MDAPAPNETLRGASALQRFLRALRIVGVQLEDIWFSLVRAHPVP